MKFLRWPSPAVARAALTCLAAWACGGGDASGAVDPADAALRALVSERVTGARLSAVTAHRACSLVAPPAGGTVPVTRCPARSAAARVLSSGDAELVRRTTEAARTGANPAALHRAALIELSWTDPAGNSIDTAISHLQSAARLTERGAGAVLSDLAAAYLARAERRQTPRDLVEALEAAAQAAQLAPRSAADRFNLALALDRLGLDDEAVGEWGEYTVLDSTSEWAGEARRRQHAIRAKLAAAAADTLRPGPGTPEAGVVAFAERQPQEARAYGWERVLDDWGAAMIAGDSARATAHLALAAALGGALERRPGGDATLGDAVRAIRAAGPNAARELARGHGAYAEGQRYYQLGKVDSAEASFRAAAGAAGERSPALRQWATLFMGAAMAYQGRVAEGALALREVAERADTARHPALAGRARWSLATTALWSGRHESAMPALADAERLFRRSGERENVGAVQSIRADAELSIGDGAAGYAGMHGALTTLRPYRRTVWRHNALVILAREAMSSGLLHAAVRLQGEGVAAASRTGQPRYEEEARLTRARVATALADNAAAERDIRDARVALARVPPPSYAWLEADARQSDALLSLGRDPARAAATLDSVVAYFAARANPVRLMPALAARAEALLAVDSVDAATAALDSAIAVLESRGRDVASLPHWALLLDATRAVIDRIVMLRVTAGRRAEALEYLERGRASLGGGGGGGRRRGVGRRGPPAVPPGWVGLEYALVGDTLLVWTVAGTEVRLTQTPLDRGALLRAVASARAALELRADDAVTAPRLAQLYEWLVGPVAGRLGPPGTPLLIVADGEIADVPFDALLDTAGGGRRYLVQDHELRLATSLRDAAALADGGGGGGAMAGPALLVADPAFDPRAFPGLQRLRGASAEADSVAARYAGRSVTLAGPAADRAAVEAGMRGARVVHFAGHALFDAERPEQSVLVLAGGRLTAIDVERLDLRGVRIVVLSACETVRGRGGHAGGAAGLTGAFLAAGAGGVVGSLWRVDDDLTRDLMVQFHSTYHATGDAAGALRAAKLAMLASPDPRRRSPAAWAGFRYVGA